MKGSPETYACLVLAAEGQRDPREHFLPRAREWHAEYDDADPPNIVREWFVEVEHSRTFVTQGRVWCATESGELIMVDVSERGAYQVGPKGPHEPRLTFDEQGRVRGL